MCESIYPSRFTLENNGKDRIPWAEKEDSHTRSYNHLGFVFSETLFRDWNKFILSVARDEEYGVSSSLSITFIYNSEVGCYIAHDNKDRDENNSSAVIKLENNQEFFDKPITETDSLLINCRFSMKRLERHVNTEASLFGVINTPENSPE